MLLLYRICIGLVKQFGCLFTAAAQQRLFTVKATARLSQRIGISNHACLKVSTFIITRVAIDCLHIASASIRD